MFIACIMLIIVGGFVIFTGIRVRALVPRRWNIVLGEWLGPALRHAPHRYRYWTPDGAEHTGETRVKVFWRPQYGGSCRVAYDSANPGRSQPAQLRGNGAVLVCVGLFAALAGVVFLAISVFA